MKQQSLNAREEEALTPRTLRRTTANATNCKLGPSCCIANLMLMREPADDVPFAVCDQAMRHNPKWATFNAVYINEIVEFYIQNAS